MSGCLPKDKSLIHISQIAAYPPNGGYATDPVPRRMRAGGYRNEPAGYGATVGAISGGAQANETQEVIIKRCLAGRGYNVLN